ncbi:MAG: prolipoprotein diacylglyceryl transferase [Deltaproteobacteria bacterium]|nr:prolipoprotein diacylglyceryl transferase [Deltaproteobacteria bacterium]
MGVIGPIPVPDLGPIQPFGLLVATGVLLGSRIVFWRSAKKGLGEDWPRRGVLAVLVGAFLFSHWVERLYYVPGPLFESWGPLELLAFWAGMSSFGGFIGALYGLMLFTGWSEASKQERNLSLALPTVAALTAYLSLTLAQLLFPVAVLAGIFLLRRSDGRRIVFADALVEGLIPGWVFGRAGCTLVYDHPGHVSDWALAMVDHSGIARHNLGLYELMLTALVLLPLVYLLRALEKKPGLVTSVVTMAYAPARFMMDYYRIPATEGGDPRYFSLTAGQYSSILLFLACLAILVVTQRGTPKPIPEPVEPPPRGGGAQKAEAGGTKGSGQRAGGKKGKNKKRKK